MARKLKITENEKYTIYVLKEKQENTIRQVEVLIEKQENTSKQVMDMNKTILNLKREVEKIKKTQSESTLEIETLGKKSGTIDVSISNRIQETEERISGAEECIENIGTTIKKKKKCKMQKDPNSKHPRNPGHNEKTKPMDNRSR